MDFVFGLNRYRWVTRYSRRGIPHQVLEPLMPRIDDTVLECVVYLYPSEVDAESGTKVGGSGFLFGIPVPWQQPAKGHLICVVTNKHIIDNGSMVVRINTKDSFDVIPLDHAKWFCHADGSDLAICPIGLKGDLHQAKFINTQTTMTKKVVEMTGAGIGDDVFVVGRFVSREGKQKNIPTVRFGNIAQMPADPIKMDDGTEQECYLVEVRSISGYSGSPVFFHVPPVPAPPPVPQWAEEVVLHTHPRRKGIYGLPIGPYLLGIDFCHIYEKERIYSDITRDLVSKDWHVRANTGMMGVIPAWKLLDIIHAPDMMKIRKDAEDKLAKDADQISLDSAKPDASPLSSDENPTHREDFNSLVGAAARKQPQGGQT